MSLLVLFRHGQASLGAADYDRLSEVGHEQARLLARHWLERGDAVDAVYRGPRERHRETWRGFVDELAEQGIGAPEPTVLDELDEHHGTTVLEHHLPLLAERETDVAELLRRHAAGEPAARREYLRVFERVISGWADGRLATPEGAEPWPRFRERVRRGLRRIAAAHAGGQTVLGFTSGGFIAAAVGEALELSDRKTAELSWTIRNAAYTELLFSSERLSLRAFNALPPVGAAHHTYV